MLDNTIAKQYYRIMILSWADSETETIWNRRFSRLLPQDIQRTAKRKLIQIHSAIALTDLRIPPGNRLENHWATEKTNGASGSMTPITIKWGGSVSFGKMEMRSM
jgi:plasmid maintenance system killer protein